MSEIREAVRARYADIAKQIAVIPVAETGADAGCCQADGPDCGCSGSSSAEELKPIGLAESVTLGCGNPAMLAELAPRPAVPALRSAAGTALLLSPRRAPP